MSHRSYTPKHAAPRPSSQSRAQGRAVLRASARRTTLIASTVAVGATGAAVGAGLLVSPVETMASVSADEASPLSVSVAPAADRETRDDSVSRSAERREARQEKREARQERKERQARREAREERRAARQAAKDPRSVARALLGEYGFSSDQFGCLDALWVSESDWEVDADNPTSSAYGIPQALTETHDLPADYMTDAETQIRWGLGYIADSYGSPCSAWSFKQGNGWY
ncbi:lytic transglycosylase domain-containing protein [uncultured Nocardioides sp.]|uniref:aggregation-promoting factor C-terminal-like domain-containing protein n=1 Tax=uncultured Nocardioides sp. TaxID=198441 RepID=UPI00262E1DFC|nr:lytic transglycosylase domain-containing protein [uncultured Nocardioides sp.]